MWEGLCRVLSEDAADGRARLANPAFATPQSRLEHREEVTEAVNGLLSSNTSAYWLQRLNEAGVPSGPINTIDQVFADPQVRHLAMVEEIPSPYFDPLRVVGQAFRLSGTESSVRLRPPEHGEHTDEILATLGYTAEAIAGLRERGIV